MLGTVSTVACALEPSTAGSLGCCTPGLSVAHHCPGQPPACRELPSLCATAGALAWCSSTHLLWSCTGLCWDMLVLPTLPPSATQASCDWACSAWGLLYIAITVICMSDAQTLSPCPNFKPQSRPSNQHLPCFVHWISRQHCAVLYFGSVSVAKPVTFFCCAEDGAGALDAGQQRDRDPEHVQQPHEWRGQVCMGCDVYDDRGASPCLTLLLFLGQPTNASRGLLLRHCGHCSACL